MISGSAYPIRYEFDSTILKIYVIILHTFLLSDPQFNLTISLQGSPEFKSTVKEIIKWLNKNQDQFVVIDLLDYISSETGCRVVPELDSSLKLFGSRLLKPSHLQVYKTTFLHSLLSPSFYTLFTYLPIPIFYRIEQVIFSP